jgi:hypothetical protein
MERCPRKPLGRIVISFSQKRRDVLRGDLVLEAVYVILRRKAVCRPCVVAEKISYRVVVLAVCEAAEFRPGSRLRP